VLLSQKSGRHLSMCPLSTYCRVHFLNYSSFFWKSVVSSFAFNFFVDTDTIEKARSRSLSFSCQYIFLFFPFSSSFYSLYNSVFILFMFFFLSILVPVALEGLNKRNCTLKSGNESIVSIFIFSASHKMYMWQHGIECNICCLLALSWSTVIKYIIDFNSMSVVSERIRIMLDLLLFQLK
jgi:hypothetical protein